MKTQTQGKIDTLFYGIMIGIILIGIIWILVEYNTNTSVSYKRGFQDGLNNCQNEKEIWVIEKPIYLPTNTIIGATAYKLNNSNILCNMFNEGCVKK